MARLPRYAPPGIAQHVIQRGNNRSALFAARNDFVFFKECLAEAAEQHSCLIHAFVFMTNHVHLLITSNAAGGTSRLMQSVGRRYVGYFNRAYRRTGTLWEGRYRATAVDTEGYLLTCYRYIELNPVRAGMVQFPGHYGWSSYRTNALGHPDTLITPHQCFDRLGAEPESRREAYRALFGQPMEEDTIQEIRERTNKGWVLGGDRFGEAIAVLAGRRPRPLRRGRKKGV